LAETIEEPIVRRKLTRILILRAEKKVHICIRPYECFVLFDKFLHTLWMFFTQISAFGQSGEVKIDLSPEESQIR